MAGTKMIKQEGMEEDRIWGSDNIENIDIT